MRFRHITTTALTNPVFRKPLKQFFISAMTNADTLKREVPAEAVASPAKKVAMPSLTTEMPPLKVKRLSEDAQLPKRGSSKAAGYDLFRYLLICCPSNTQ